MAKKSHLSFANLTMRFGDRFVLLDLAQEVTFPAFFSEDHVRSYGTTKYFFRDVGIDAFNIEGEERPQLSIYGRFIKDTFVKRDQVFREGHGLISDQQALESAPSMFFVLDLENHKLIYFPEVSGAPSARQFGATLQAFARAELSSYIRALSEESKRTADPKGIGELHVEYPEPIVEVTPLSSDGKIDTVVAEFDRITRVTFRLLNTNAEFSRGEDFKRMREMKDDVASNETTLTHVNKAGLRKDGVSGELKVAAAGGNQRITVKGVAIDGTPYEVSNEDLKLQIPFRSPPEDRNLRAAEMLRSYYSQVKAGRLRPDSGTPNVLKLDQLRGGLDGSER